MSYPMMAERRTVIVKNMHMLSPASFTMLAKYVENPAPTTCLILAAQKLDFRKSSLAKIKSKSKFIEAKPLYDNQVPEWIRSYASEQQLKIADDAIRLLHASTGSSLRRISTEIEKIKLNLLNKNTIEITDVERVVGISREYNVFELCDAVGSKKTAKSLNILSGMLQLGEVPSGLLAMLNRHFTIIAKLKELKKQNFRREQIAKELRINPFFVDNYARQAGQFNSSQISKVFDILLDADFQIKTSYQKPKMVMELAIIKLGNL
jgi:DNA polymerase III subunit delta